MRSILWLSGALLAAVLVGPAVAQQSPPQTPHDHGATTSDQHPGMKMMTGEDHQRMMADMKAADERLQQLVTKMNAENGEQKVRTMAELLTTLVANHTSMKRQMMDMGACPMAQSPPK